MSENIMTMDPNIQNSESVEPNSKMSTIASEPNSPKESESDLITSKSVQFPKTDDHVTLVDIVKKNSNDPNLNIEYCSTSNSEVKNVVVDESQNNKRGVKRTFEMMLEENRNHSKIENSEPKLNSDVKRNFINNNNNEVITNRNDENDSIASADNAKNTQSDKDDEAIINSVTKKNINTCDNNKSTVEVKDEEILEKSTNFQPISPSSSKSDSERKVYGLRPRSALRRLWVEDSQDNTSTSPEPSKSNSTLETPKQTKPKSSEYKTTKSSKSSSSGPKNRNSRGKPLSKYRRITANARERDRMKEINSAFATLRAVLPTFANCRIASMTKYSTLQMAVSYIKGLSELLNETNNGENMDVKKENFSNKLCSEEENSSSRDVNLSVGISEIKCGSLTSGSDEQKASDYLMFSNANTFSFSDDTMQGFDDIENLPDMRWALDLMLE